MAQSQQQLLDAIAASPKEHNPMPYHVFIKDKRDKPVLDKGGNSLSIYVRASSRRRAILSAVYRAIYTFNNKKAVSGSALPSGWTDAKHREWCKLEPTRFWIKH